MEPTRLATPAASTRQQTVRDLLQLAMLPGVGPRTLSELLDRFGTAAAVLSAGEADLYLVPGVGKAMVQKIRSAADHVCVDEILRWCDDHRTRIVAIDDDDYPMPLKDLVDPPPLLFVQGDRVDSDSIAVAIVGTRHGTAYGLRQAQRFAYGLAQAGVTVVSGLARGIDSAAHQGALDGGGRTIAVLGGGMAHLYPPENQSLADRCAMSGAVIAEYPPATKPHAGTFPQRNRLIAGLSLATLVIEAPQRSGSLITARLAGEMNRDVLALPGAVTSRASQGCHQLIRDGATLVQSVQDVLESLGPMATPVTINDGHTVHNPAELMLNDPEQTVLQAIDANPTLIDDVIRRCGLPAHRVLSTISVLEMRRLVRRLSGQYVTR